MSSTWPRNVIAAYSTTKGIPQPDVVGSHDHSTMCSHGALGIAEILCSILREVEPESCLTAWDVSKFWRACLQAVIEEKEYANSFNKPWPCKPITYGQPIDPQLLWMQPTANEIESVWKDQCRLLNQTPGIWYLEARFTQAKNLPPDMVEALDYVDTHSSPYRWRTPPKPMPTSRGSENKSFWLDFSQLQLSPYLTNILQDRIMINRGRCEIALQPAGNAGEMLVERSKIAMIDAISEMYITQPPIQVLGIYHTNVERDRRRNDDNCFSDVELLGRIQDPQGIRVGQLFTALREHSSTVSSAWIDQATKYIVEKGIAIGHWVDDIWLVPGRPKMVLLLDNKEMRDGIDIHWHVSRPMYVTARALREEREAEWVPKEWMEPGKTLTVMSQINWNRWWARHPHYDWE